jgi:hypothetical protein
VAWVHEGIERDPDLFLELEPLIGPDEALNLNEYEEEDEDEDEDDR